MDIIKAMFTHKYVHISIKEISKNCILSFFHTPKFVSVSQVNIYKEIKNFLRKYQTYHLNHQHMLSKTNTKSRIKYRINLYCLFIKWADICNACIDELLALGLKINMITNDLVNEKEHQRQCLL